jgi:hypothetical protein
MTLQKKGKYWYGSTAEDTKTELVKYSKLNGYTATKFSESVCTCGNRAFKLETDEDEGTAKRICTACEALHLMGDSAEYASSANFENHVCVCNSEMFQLLSGVALYDESNDVRWYYIGCLCTKCSLVGVFADWKCEAGDADAFLAGC